MKKLLILLAITMTFAANALTSDTKSAEITLQEKQYKKIDSSKVAPEALEKIKKGYGNYAIKEAYVATDGEYKLILTKDNIDLTATFTAAGDLIKIL
jgi:hypothetical protein